MKTEASEDKGWAADGYRQRSGRLCVNRALNHIRIIVIGFTVEPTEMIHIYVVIYFTSCQDGKKSSKLCLHVADENVCSMLSRQVDICYGHHRQ